MNLLQTRTDTNQEKSEISTMGNFKLIWLKWCSVNDKFSIFYSQNVIQSQN